MIVKHLSKIKGVEVKGEGAEKVIMKILIGEEDGAPNFIMRYFRVNPGGRTHLHSHPWEHEVYFLRGTAEILGGGERKKIAAGAAVFIPPNEEHQIVNIDKNPLDFICIIPIVER